MDSIDNQKSFDCPVLKNEPLTFHYDFRRGGDNEQSIFFPSYFGLVYKP